MVHVMFYSLKKWYNSQTIFYIGGFVRAFKNNCVLPIE